MRAPRTHMLSLEGGRGVSQTEKRVEEQAGKGPADRIAPRVEQRKNAGRAREL